MGLLFLHHNNQKNVSLQKYKTFYLRFARSNQNPYNDKF